MEGTLILSAVLALAFAWLAIRGVSYDASIVRMEADRFILREGFLRKRERELDLSEVRWIGTESLKGAYIKLLLPDSASIKSYRIEPGAAPHQAIMALVESRDLNWFNEEIFHGGFADQFHRSVRHPLSMDELTAILTGTSNGH